MRRYFSFPDGLWGKFRNDMYMQILCKYKIQAILFTYSAARVPTCLYVFMSVIGIPVKRHDGRLRAAFSLSFHYISVCLCCCWVVRVDTNALSCGYTRADPAKTPLVTVVTIKCGYNWFTALFCLSVRREKVQVTVTVPASDKAYFAGCRHCQGINAED